MAVRHGYGKVAGTDALIFAYDTGDTRNSYKGEPTVNLAINPTFSSTSNWLIASNGGGTFSVLNNYGKITAGNTGSYSYVYQSINTTVASNENITWSIEFKNNVIGDYAIRVVLFLNGTPKTQPTTFFTLDGTGGIVRKSVTTSHVEGGNSIRIDILQGSYYAGINTDNNLEFTNAQLERNSHATPFVNGTRSSTQGLLDLTGTRSIEIANASFTSNAQMTFDGTNDQIYVNNPSFSFPPTGSRKITHEYVIKFDSTYTGGWQMFNQGPAAFYTAKIVGGGTDGKLIIMLSIVSANYWHYSTRSVSDNVYNHIVFTMEEDSNSKWYINGELDSTVTQSPYRFNTLSTDVINTLRFGRGYDNTTWFKGDIPVAKVYNRALTADEVRNNFRHYKTRFNI